MDCIFCRIIKKEIPSDIVYEDDKILCFKDVAPQAPVHCLLIPKKHFEDLFTMQKDDLALMSHLIGKIPEIARKMDLEENGFRLVHNCKEMAGQSVFHLHFHLMGGRTFSWPPG